MAEGTCEQGERADLTGCIPASVGPSPFKKTPLDPFSPEAEAQRRQRFEQEQKESKARFEKAEQIEREIGKTQLESAIPKMDKLDPKDFKTQEDYDKKLMESMKLVRDDDAMKQTRIPSEDYPYIFHKQVRLEVEKRTAKWRKLHSIEESPIGKKLTASEVQSYLKTAQPASAALEMASEAVRENLPEEDIQSIYKYVFQDRSPDDPMITASLNKLVEQSAPIQQDLKSYRGMRIPSEEIENIFKNLEQGNEASIELRGPRSFTDNKLVAQQFANKTGYRKNKGDAGLVLEVLIPNGTKIGNIAMALGVGWEHAVGSGHKIRIVKGTRQKTKNVFIGVLEKK